MAQNYSRKRSPTPAAIISAAEPEVPKPATQKAERNGQSTSREADLEKELSRAIKERDELKRDVEALCMQSGSSIFDGSMVLSERIFQAEKELSKLRDQLTAVTEERNDLREDLKGYKDTKRTVEESWRVERGRAEKLEKELQFYQGQSAQAMADRDKAAWEAEELKRGALDMEARLKSAESKAEFLTGELAAAESQLGEARGRVQSLEVKAKASETIPGLWKHIAESTQRIKSMEVNQDVLERNLSLAKTEQQEAKEALTKQLLAASSATRELEELRARAQKEAENAAAEINSLKARVDELEEAAVSREVRLEEAEASLAAAQAEVETQNTRHESAMNQQSLQHSEELASLSATQAAKVEALTEELESVRASLKSVTAEFEQARSDKLQALMRASQAEATAEQAFQETGRMMDEMNDYKDRAAQATQEKVAALMQVASLKEQLRSNASSSPQPASKSSQPPAAAKTASPPSRIAYWRSWVMGGPAEGEEGTPGEAPKTVPQDLREAIDQLRELHERLAELDNLAKSAQELRFRCATLHGALTDTPTHLQRKELGMQVGQLRSALDAIRSEHGDLLPPEESAAGTEKAGKAKTPWAGEGSAASELLSTLNLVVDSLEALSQRML